LAQEQGISFLVGIAVGVNLILLLQMSENIINKLSEMLTGSIIGIAAIISTVIVGVTIIYIQIKLVRRINKFIEQRHKMTEDENRLDKEMILDYNKL
jgi:ABC-type Mn2+/Zn2+ transport system permease subunit